MSTLAGGRRPVRLSAELASAGSFELELLSPARVSLFLRILGRRDDGFHDSASLFQAVSVGDRLRLARIPGDEVAAAGVVRPSRKSEPIKQNVEFSVSPAGIANLPTDQTNTVVRALTLYRRKLTERDGGSFAVPRFRAHLVKSLPLDAGLGGAASNAAAALYGANELCGRLASPAELSEWAAALGPDVPAFLAGSALCTGRAVFLRGDRVEALPHPLAGPAEGAGGFFLVAPELELSTPALFRRLAADGYSGLSGAQPRALLGALGAAGAAGPAGAPQPHALPGVAALFVNDLEAAALEACAPLAAVRARLREHEGFRVAAMSGAGPVLFAFGRESDEPAGAFAARFERECTEAAGVKVRVWPAQFASGPEVSTADAR